MNIHQNDKRTDLDRAYQRGKKEGAAQERKEILEVLTDKVFCTDRLSKCSCTDEHELQNRVYALIEQRSS
jgi:hypothetical protein